MANEKNAEAKQAEGKVIDLLEKYSRKTNLLITEAEDDSSQDTEVVILHLKEPILAESSIPSAEGPIRVKSDKVYVAAEDIARMKEHLKEDPKGGLVYSGKMSLDVSKPRYINRNGKLEMVSAARVWLRSVKFSRSGQSIRTNNRQSISDTLKTLFKDKTIDLTLATDTTGKPREMAPEPVA